MYNKTDIKLLYQIMALVALKWILHKQKTVDSRFSLPNERYNYRQQTPTRLCNAFSRCIMTNTRQQACQGRMQIGCVYHIFNHSLC